VRAYRLEPAMRVVGMTVADVERLATERIFIERVRRRGEVLQAAPDMVLEAGDTVALIGRHEILVRVIGERATEIYDRDLLDMPVATYDVVLTNAELAGRTLGDADRDKWRGVFVKAIRRNGQPIPIALRTRLMVGDVLTLHGFESIVKRSAPTIGPVLQLGGVTDYVALGLAIFVGALLGLVISFPVGGMHIAIGTSVATLLVGLAMGWRNSVRPTFGTLAADAGELMTSIGLAAFVAMIGLKAGPVFIQALKEIGVTVFLGGVAVTLMPQLIGLLVGRYVLKLNPVLLLGALAGAQTMTAALAAVQERSKSPVAVIGYSSTVAFGHILLSIAGTALVWILHS
jgi:putative transport protein